MVDDRFLHGEIQGKAKRSGKSKRREGCNNHRRFINCRIWHSITVKLTITERL